MFCLETITIFERLYRINSKYKTKIGYVLEKLTSTVVALTKTSKSVKKVKEIITTISVVTTETEESMSFCKLQ